MIHARPLALASAAFLLAASAAPGDASNLLALLDTGELYVSANGGAAWTPQAALPVRDAVGLAAGASSLDLFLATRSGSIYRSLDGGGSWSAVGSVAASDVAGFAIGPFGSVLALTRSGTLYSSSNQGTTFSAIAALAASDWVSLARGPLGRLYALARTGHVAESQDQGSTWATVGVITTSNAVAIRRLGNVLYVLNETGEIYRSINYGASWTAVAALTSSSMGSLVDLGGALVAAAREGEVASSPNGASWTWVGAINQLNVIALATDAPNVTGVQTELSPPRFVVRAPYPNPSVGSAGSVFSFTTAEAGPIVIELFDAQGRLARTRETYASPGPQSFRWRSTGIPAGTYQLRLTTHAGSSAAVKWTILR